MLVQTCTRDDIDDWVRLRAALWPESTEREHRLDALGMLGEPERMVAFVIREEDGTAIGFAEAALRRDWVNGCTTSPVGFLEGIYVDPAHRRRGIARALCAAVETWASDLGCTELASDAYLDNTVSHRMHGALGFAETERVVYFRKPLRAAGDSGSTREL